MIIIAVVFGALGFLIGWLIRTYLISSKGGLGTGGAIGLCAVVWVVTVLVLATLLQGKPDYHIDRLLDKAIAQQHQGDPSWVPSERQPVRHESSSPLAGGAAFFLSSGLFIGVRRRKQQDYEKKECRPNTQSDEINALLLAAEQGDADAQYSLSVRYETGQGVEKNRWEALKWLNQSAECNNADAQYALGMFYGQDTWEAYGWLSLASINGKLEAAGMLRSVEQSLSPTKLMQARYWLEEWKRNRAPTASYFQNTPKKSKPQDVVRDASIADHSDETIVIICTKCSNRMRVLNLPEDIQVTCPSCARRFKVPGYAAK